MDLIVAEHALIHGLTEGAICYAWENYLRQQQRPSPNEEFVAAIGVTQKGDMVQMVGKLTPYGIVVIHALRPPTEKVLKELGLAR